MSASAIDQHEQLELQRPDTLTALLENVARARPHATALVGPQGRLSYAGLAAAVRRVAEGLSRQGVEPGDRVALWLPNRPEFMVLQFALARLGACAIHLNTRYRADELGHILDRARPTAVATAWGFPPVDFPALLDTVLPDSRAPLRFVVGLDTGGVKQVGGLPVVRWEALDGMPEREADDAAPGAACLTWSTSGTTAGPKLVMQCQESIAGHAADVAHKLGLTAPGATVLGVVPFCGTFGFVAALAGLAGGGRVVTVDRFEAASCDALIRKEAATHMVGGDDMALRLIDAAGGQPYPQPLWFGFAGFDPASRPVAELGDPIGLRCAGVYGSSEVQALFSSQDPSDAAHRGLGGGVPMSGAAELRARDPETGALGERGELEMRAPSLFAGYMNNPEATAKAMTPDGYFRTGDLGRIDPACGFVFEARLGDALRLGGFTVGPEEIEGFLKRLPGVQDAQVVGAAAGDGAVAVAFLRAEPGATLDEAAILEACRAELARFKVPRRAVVVEEFPTTDSPNGPKVQRAKLREMAAVLLEPSPTA